MIILSLQDVDHRHQRSTGQNAAFSASEPGWEQRELSSEIEYQNDSARLASMISALKIPASWWFTGLRRDV